MQAVAFHLIPLRMACAKACRSYPAHVEGGNFSLHQLAFAGYAYVCNISQLCGLLFLLFLTGCGSCVHVLCCQQCERVGHPGEGAEPDLH